MQRRRLLAASIALCCAGASRLHRKSSADEFAHKEHGWKPLEMVADALKHGMLDQGKPSETGANESLTVCRQQVYKYSIM